MFSVKYEYYTYAGSSIILMYYFNDSEALNVSLSKADINFTVISVC